MNYCICTKQLQYVNSKFIDIDGEIYYLISDSFTGAKEFYENTVSNYNDKSRFFKSIKAIYTFLILNVRRGDFIFIDSDYGLKKNIWLSPLLSKRIYVYEEGYGSYRSDLLSSRSLNVVVETVLKKVLRLNGYFGAGWWSKGIYVYDVEKHKRLVNDASINRYQLKGDFLTNLVSIENEFDYMRHKYVDVVSRYSDKDVLIYLASWYIDDSVISQLSDKVGWVKILKLHPHIKQRSEFVCFDYIIEGDVMFELLLLDLLRYVRSIAVYHHNSAAMMYVDHERISNVNLGFNQCLLDRVKENL